MKKNEIIVTYGTNYKQMAKGLLLAAEIEKHIGDPDRRIGIKPNVLDACPAEDGATTHPQVVAGIIEYLQERGFDRLVIMEGSWVGGRTKEAFAACGYEDISRTYKVPLIDTQAEAGVMTECGGMDISICESVKNIDFLINVPVLKGHCQTVVTCALKNMKGLIPNTEKRRFHTLGLHDPIAHLNVGIRQNFILVDSICGDPNFEDGGHPFVTNRMYAAIDPVLCDAYGCELLGHAPAEVGYIAKAQKLGVGSSDLSQAKVRILQNYDKKPRMPVTDLVTKLSDNVEEVESCSACYAYLMPALEQLDQEGLLSGLQDKICIGQGYRGCGGVLGVGNCTRLFEHTLAGCPPVESEIYAFLKAYIQNR